MLGCPVHWQPYSICPHLSCVLCALASNKFQKATAGSWYMSWASSFTGIFRGNNISVYSFHPANKSLFEQTHSQISLWGLQVSGTFWAKPHSLSDILMFVCLDVNRQSFVLCCLATSGCCPSSVLLMRNGIPRKGLTAHWWCQCFGDCKSSIPSPLSYALILSNLQKAKACSWYMTLGSSFPYTSGGTDRIVIFSLTVFISQKSPLELVSQRWSISGELY